MGDISAAAGLPVVVEPISSKADRKTFVDVHFRLNADDPNWVPPLRAEAMEMIDPARNPFFEHAEVEAWVAERAGEGAPRVVGRIAAIVNRTHNEFHGDRVGFWGFFECENDAETAQTAELLKEINRDKTVIVVEHDMTFVRELGVKVTCLHEGTVIAEGTIDQVSSNERVIEVYLGR